MIKIKVLHLKWLIIFILKTAQANYDGSEQLYSESAVNLLLGTAAQESHMGKYLKQFNNGPARGWYHIEPETEKSIWEDYIKYKPELKIMLVRLGITRESCYKNSFEWSLGGNITYQTIMARLKYLWSSTPLPAHDDINGLAWYWKRNFNTLAGKGTTKEFVYNYNKYVLEE